jgi:cobalamin biosynthesis Mg chelatase CobN
VDLTGAPETLWLRLLETEEALIPDGLHIVGRPMDARARARDAGARWAIARGAPGRDAECWRHDRDARR